MASRNSLGEAAQGFAKGLDLGFEPDSFELLQVLTALLENLGCMLIVPISQHDLHLGRAQDLFQLVGIWCRHCCPQVCVCPFYARRVF